MRHLLVLFTIGLPTIGLPTIALTLCAAPAFAADPRYPDWPCMQAKVPEISLAAVWAGPDLGDATQRWKSDPATRDMVARLAARRTPLEEAERLAGEFVSGDAAARTEKGTMLFAGLFETLNAERSAVMAGLERFTRRQREMAAKVRADTLALQNLQDASPADPAKVDELSREVTWETRIFEDRRKMVQYVCDVPAAIDQRLFGLGRAIQEKLDE